MKRTVTRYPHLGRVFPGGQGEKSKLANLAFRLCVFREDMLLEIKLLSHDCLGESIDRGDPLARKIYATRRSAITLIESSKAMHESVADYFCKSGKAKESLEVFSKSRETVKENVEALRKTRNQSGAHLDKSLIQKILDNQPSIAGELRIGSPYLADTYYGLPVHAMLASYSLDATTDAAATESFKEFLTKMQTAHYSGLQAIDAFFFAYTTEIRYWDLGR